MTAARAGPPSSAPPRSPGRGSPRPPAPATPSTPAPDPGLAMVELFSFFYINTFGNFKRVLFSKNPIHCLTVNVHLELPLRIEFALSLFSVQFVDIYRFKVN